MPLLKDRVLETTSTSGTGSFQLAGTKTGYRTFSSAFSSGDSVYYCITYGSEWEVGYGTLTTGSPWTLSRDGVLASSNSNAIVSFSAGIKEIFCTAAAAGLVTTTNINNATLPASFTTLNASGFTTVSKNSTALQAPTLTSVMQISEASGLATRVLIDAYGSGPLIDFRRANNTPASPSAVPLDNTIGGITGMGYGTTGYGSTPRARIVFNAAENWTDTAQGAYITFQTTSIGATTINGTERMRIPSDGGLVIRSIQSAAPTNLAVEGYLSNATIDTDTGYIRQLFDTNYGFGTYWKASRGANGGWYGGSLGVRTSNTDLDVITWRSSGMVGIGLVPTSEYGILQLSQSNGTALTFAASSTCGLAGFNSEAYLTSNVTLSSGGSWKARAAYASSVSAEPGHIKFRIDSGLVNGNAFSPTTRMHIDYNGNVGINITPSGSYKLEVNGSFAATSKSFKIPHPTGKSRFLVYGSLESPYHGIRLTGKNYVQSGLCKVELPEYIGTLCSVEGVTIQLTNYKHGKTLWVEEINLEENYFLVKGDFSKWFDSEINTYQFFWSLTAIRKDIDPLLVEQN